MTRLKDASWFSRVRSEWLIVIFTALATAFFTAAGQYVATVKVENDKIVSANILKTADDFQTRFSSILNNLQKFTVASVNDKKISERDRADLLSSILGMQLTMAPASGRWPSVMDFHLNHFFSELAGLQKVIKNASNFSDLEGIEVIVKRLIVSDMEIMKSMQKEAQVRYWF